MPRPKVLAAAFAFALLAEPAAAPRTAAAVAPAATVQNAPGTMRGVIRYRRRGASAVTGGIMSSAVAGTMGGATIMSRSMTALGKILGGGAGHLSDKASPGDLAKLGRGGSQMPDLNDLISRIPINAEYAADVSFVLRQAGDGVFELQSGSVHWSASTDAEVKLTGEGNTHHFKDQFRGGGTATLDPRSSTIRIAPAQLADGSKGDMDVDIGISHEMIVNGTSMWSAMNGLQVITMNSQGGIRSTQLQFLGQTWPAEKAPDPLGGGFAYGRRMPVDSLFRYREIFQDLMDAGEVIEWEIYDECSAKIETPEYFDELVFDLSTTGRIERPVKADVQPTFWDEDLHWKFMPMSGSDIDPPPARADGNDFDLTYAKLPPKNASFGFWLLEAEFATERAKKGGCKNPEPNEIGYFYSREADNNPGPAAWAPNTKGSGPVPNWFFYWTQTAAAVNRAYATYYGVGSTSCNRRGVGGYAPLGTTTIVFCDIGREWGFKFTVPWVDYSTDGIDTYGAVALHEWKHIDDYKKWWPAGHSAVLDTDNDRIPDLLESSVAVPAPLNGKHKFFDNDKHDTLGLGFEDEHYFAYMAMLDWKEGSADHQDWSCPGHQATGDCQ